MSNVIKKIFESVNDDEVHNAFIKFSKGTFNDRYLLDAKAQKDKWAIKSGAEYVNTIVEKCLRKSQEKVNVKGVIVSTMNLREEVNFEFERVKQFMGIKQLIINTELDRDDLLSLMERLPKAFYALSFKGDDFDLKVKAKAPKGAKPSNKADKEVKADFCTLKTPDKEIIDELFFDLPEGWKIAKVNHSIVIDNIELPSGVSDPVELREKAKRGGKIVRRVSIDEGDAKESEKEFLA
tara:strand:+ start:1087 stop:1797 length:711 start_codon:yes stop_codon:yes gene_type:complete